MNIIKRDTSFFPFTPCQESQPMTSGVHTRQLYNAGQRGTLGKVNKLVTLQHIIAQYLFTIVRIFHLLKEKSKSCIIFYHLFAVTYDQNIFDRMHVLLVGIVLQTSVIFHLKGYLSFMQPLNRMGKRIFPYGISIQVYQIIVTTFLTL